jgi:hypothetical protein
MEGKDNYVARNFIICVLVWTEIHYRNQIKEVGRAINKKSPKDRCET